MKKLLLLACLATTPVFALPAMNFDYEGEGGLMSFKDKTVSAYDTSPSHMCGIDGNAKLTQKSAKSFTITGIDGLNGKVCDEPDVKTMQGVVLATKNNKVTKFKILGKHYFSGVYKISQ